MKLMYFLSFLLFLSSCGGSSKVESDQSMEDENAIVYDVEIRTTQTYEYCGGSRPTEEMMNELETPKPLANTTIYLREGEVNDISLPIAYALKSNENGLIHAKIKKGTYSLVFEYKKDQATFDSWLEKYGQASMSYSAIDINCFTTFFKRPDQLIQIVNLETDSLTNQFAVNRLNRCERTRVPCASYKGPVRPAATPKE